MKYWRKTLRQDQAQPDHYQIYVLNDRCKGCRICIEFCPKQVIHESTKLNRKGYHTVYADGNNHCLNCGLCELICPEFAISVDQVEEDKVHD
ncbi:ferredoxin family protein [Chloroflexota bacterium]